MDSGLDVRRRDLTRTTARSGLTILELLVTISVIGLLAALLLPAMAAAREAARRVECTSHLRQVGIGLFNYHDVHNSLPAGWQWDRQRSSAYGWSVSLLPYLEQRPLAESMDRSKSLVDPGLTEARLASLALLRCPSDVAPRQFLLTDEDGEPIGNVEFAAANFLGVYGTSEPDDVRPVPPGDGTFINSRPVRLAEFTRGLSCTLIVGERSFASFPATWIGFDDRDEDGPCRIVGEAKQGPNCAVCDECEFSSRHAGMSQFLWGDGHVQSVANTIDLTVYQQMARRQD